LAENENYDVLPENVKVKIVKENLMLEFQEMFDILFIDPEFDFRADKRLITKVIASLSYEHFEAEESILRLDVVSSEIYFIYEGEVKVTYKDSGNVLMYFDPGSYIGDTSYIFKIRNQYKYRCIADGKQKPRIYALHD
jgi:CRP-like cAMP-binding protein